MPNHNSENNPDKITKVGFYLIDQEFDNNSEES